MNTTYNYKPMMEIFLQAKHILRYSGTVGVPQRENDWFYRETTRYDLHPIVWAAMKAARPHNWQQLLLEWPHQSVNDAARIAYTRDERAGITDKQTVTSVGKYLRRHWPALPDHDIRDLVQRYGTNSDYKLVHTMAEMLHHLANGPGSCMVWHRSGVRCADGTTRHPYEVYNPKYGWHMAVGILNGETVSRALCMDNKETGNKYYVRTYLRPTRDGDYSQVDGGLEHWLKEQGYVKKHSWQDGEKFDKYEVDGTVLMPFLDGNDKLVADGDDHLYMDCSGRYVCNRTDGLANDDEEDDESYFNCESCGDRTHDDDGYWVTRNEDEHVCQSCLENDYTYVYGRRGNQYHVCNDYAVRCDSDDEYYDEDYLSDNNVVMLDNGGCVSLDDAVCVDGDWYHVDDEDVCYAEDTGDYALRENCWHCAESNNMYTDDCTDYVELNDERYHNDHIPSWVQAELDAADETKTPTETTTQGE